MQEHEVAAALTAEEWEQGEVEIGTCSTIHADMTIVLDDCAHTSLTGYADARRHALAALALHGQPFGFTREDAARHRVHEQSFEARLVLYRLAPIEGGNGVEVLTSERDWHRSMAERIEALLPPEGA